MALTLGLALGQAESAVAGAFKVTPVRVALSAEAASALVTVRNEGSEPLRLQVSAFTWEQDETGRMQLTPTEDVLVFPGLLTVEPAQERTLRVGTAARFGAAERSYRFFLEELPPPEKAGEPATQIRMLARVGIPVFLQPARAQAQGRIDGAAVREGRLALAVRNDGNVHFVLQALQVKGLAASGETRFERRLDGWYVLAGGSRAYELELPREECPALAALEVEALTSIGTYTTRLAPGAADCAR